MPGRLQLPSISACLQIFYFVLVMGTAIQWFAEFVVKSVCGVVVVAFYIF